MVSELPLPSGRRADLVALGGDGEILIVEIKSSVADFRADQKWMDYRLHCDRLFFATVVDVPREIFPADAGLIVADAFGASIVVRSAGASSWRRRGARPSCCGLRMPRRCACRSLADPQGPYGGGESKARPSACGRQRARPDSRGVQPRGVPAAKARA